MGACANNTARPILRYSRCGEVQQQQLTALNASETTAKGTGLEKSAGKEDPEHALQRGQQ